jgi:hypothetical protein
MMHLEFPDLDLILLVAALIIVIRGINLVFKILHRLVDRRLPCRDAAKELP